MQLYCSFQPHHKGVTIIFLPPFLYYFTLKPVVHKIVVSCDEINFQLIALLAVISSYPASSRTWYIEISSLSHCCSLWYWPKQHNKCHHKDRDWWDWWGQELLLENSKSSFGILPERLWSDAKLLSSLELVWIPSLGSLPHGKNDQLLIEQLWKCFSIHQEIKTYFILFSIDHIIKEWWALPHANIIQSTRTHAKIFNCYQLLPQVPSLKIIPFFQIAFWEYWDCSAILLL